MLLYPLSTLIRYALRKCDVEVLLRPYCNSLLLQRASWCIWTNGTYIRLIHYGLKHHIGRRSWSVLVQVLGCCMAALNHNQKQYWYHHWGHVAFIWWQYSLGVLKSINDLIVFENYTSKSIAASAKRQWLKCGTIWQGWCLRQQQWDCCCRWWYQGNGITYINLYQICIQARKDITNILLQGTDSLWII